MPSYQMEAVYKNRRGPQDTNIHSKNIFEDFVIDKVLDKDNTPAVMAFGTHRYTGTKVAFKFFISGESPYKQKIDYERYMYEGLIYDGIKKLESDHNLVKLIFRTRLDGFPRPRVEYPNLKLLLDKLTSKYLEYDKPIINVIVTEAYPTSVTFNDLFAKKEMTEERLRSCMFQTIATLLMLKRLQVQHNDLHPGNILLVKEPPEKALIYHIDGKRYEVDMKYGKVLLFDWDMAYCLPCGRNSVLDQFGCKMFGACNSPNYKSDLFMLLQDQYSKDCPEYQQFKKRVIKAGKRNVVNGYLCNGTPGNCQPFPFGEDIGIEDLEVALTDIYFSQYEIEEEIDMELEDDEYEKMEEVEIDSGHYLLTTDEELYEAFEDELYRQNAFEEEALKVIQQRNGHNFCILPNVFVGDDGHKMYSHLGKKNSKTEDYDVAKLIENIRTCTTNMAVLPLNVYSHERAIIFNAIRRTIEVFDPHGKALYRGEELEAAARFISHHLPEFKLEPSDVTKPESGYGVQFGISGHKHEGTCVAWTLYLIDLRAKHMELPSWEISEKSIHSIDLKLNYKTMQEKFADHIRDYIVGIMKEMEVYKKGKSYVVNGREIM